MPLSSTAAALGCFGATLLAGVVVTRQRALHRPPRGGVDARSGVDCDLLATLATYRSLFGLAARRCFHLDWRFTHLNTGSYGVTPRCVTAAAAREQVAIESFPDAFFRRTALPRYRAACARAAQFVGADEAGTVLVDNATTGVNCVLRSLVLSAGDGILINDNTYNACKNAVAAVAAATGAIVVVMSFPLPVASPAELQGALEAALAAKPAGVFKFVLLDHITSPTGVVMPIKSMAAACLAAGARVCVDGAHAPGQLPLSLSGLGVHWYTGEAAPSVEGGGSAYVSGVVVALAWADCTRVQSIAAGAGEA